ncbi:hypothetical protein EJ05DRAFT_509038 [Pseudovirgaria hyperparasitica]|uniref:Uncharacterized protein n=1 Tax=Pseudovirgaria hyperparasitica TaxID=470096 RepID=A0A6A6WCF0_9PEZI|nr:uncharacterized protein EJ05DRAFT_509038 [Pseudovirgaria hyperparasitica]KAF2760508.1 hypothetical protein EJ05DRAFT_509038 [Pseudovirgaria hyperparasitica]
MMAVIMAMDVVWQTVKKDMGDECDSTSACGPPLPRSASGPADTRPRPNINAPVDPNDLARRLEVARLEAVATELRHRQTRSSDATSKQQPTGVHFKVTSQDVKHHVLLHALPDPIAHTRRPRHTSKPPPLPLPTTNPEALIQDLAAFQRKDIPSPQITPMTTSFPHLHPQTQTRPRSKSKPKPKPTFLSPYPTTATATTPSTLPTPPLSPQPATLSMFPTALRASPFSSSIRRPRSAPLESIPISDFSRFHLLLHPLLPAAPDPTASSPVIPRGSLDLGRPSSSASVSSSLTTKTHLGLPRMRTRTRAFSSLSGRARPGTAPHAERRDGEGKRGEKEDMTPECRALLAEQERCLADLRRLRRGAGAKRGKEVGVEGGEGRDVEGEKGLGKKEGKEGEMPWLEKQPGRRSGWGWRRWKCLLFSGARTR